MLQKVNSAGVATAIRASNTRVVNPAQEPMLPYRPDLALNTALGSAGGLLLAIVVCFLGEAVERRNRKRWRPGETTQYLKLPELGVIPPVRVTGGWLAKKGSIRSLLSEGGAPEHSHVALWKQRPSQLVASFHAALDFLLFARRGEAPPQVVVITSALPLEGKTTIASYLALALADIGKRVLLIDADLRSPRLHEQFGTANGSGLTNLLESDAVPETVGLNTSVVRTSIQGIDLMPSGPAGKTVARLLASDKLGELVAGLRDKYDTILIDTPPVLLFPDARVIGRHSDGVVLVVRSNQTPLATHQRAAQSCESSGNHVLGAILNDWKPAAKLGYYRYYRKYAGT
jgi:capsular exopolysaccharide synthesis family protein